MQKNKIIHRDIKPQNSLIHNSKIKIADFGFCKELIADQLTKTMLGSPIYMAPQVLKGTVYDNRADIWSLGVILYEMLSPRQVGDAKKKDRDRKEKSVGPKQRELHELP